MKKDGELGLKNTLGKGFCMILWLLSIEPPFYAAISNASRLMNLKYLEFVGPLARVLFEILKNGENNRQDKEA